MKSKINDDLLKKKKKDHNALDIANEEDLFRKCAISPE